MRFPEYTEKTFNCQIGNNPFRDKGLQSAVAASWDYSARGQRGHFPRTPDDLAQSLPVSLLFRGPGLAPLEKLFGQSIQDQPALQRHDRHAVHQIAPQPLGDPAQNLFCRLLAARCLGTQKSLSPSQQYLPPEL